MTEYSFNADLDGQERSFSLPLNNAGAAKQIAGHLLNVLVIDGAIRNGFVAVGEGRGEEVQWLGSWAVSEGCSPEWQAED